MPKKVLIKQIGQLIKVYALLLGISDYNFKSKLVNPNAIKTKDDLINSYATVDVDEETRKADIDINKDLLREHPRELRNTIVHELLHIRLNELMHFVYTIIENHVKDKKARKTYKAQLETIEHKIIVPLVDAVLDKKKWRN